MSTDGLAMDLRPPGPKPPTNKRPLRRSTTGAPSLRTAETPAGDGATLDNRRRMCARLGWTSLAVLAAGSAFDRALPRTVVIWPVAVAALLPPALVVALVLSRRVPKAPQLRWSAGAAMVGGTCALGVAMLVSHPRPAWADVPAIVADGVRTGWSDLLGSTLPAVATADALVVPTLLTAMAALVGIECVFRLKAAAVPALPALCLYLLALVIGGVRLTPTAATQAALVLLAVLALSRRPDVAGGDRIGRAAAVRSLGRRTATTALVAVCAALLAAVVPVHRDPPYDLRDDRRFQVDLGPDVNPLSKVAGWLAEPEVPLFTVTPASLDGSAAPASRNRRWRLAAFDRFDGQQWSSSSAYLRPGISIPGAAVCAGRDCPRVGEDVEISGLSGVFLPAAATPVRVDGVDLAVDPLNGLLASQRPLHPGLRYSVVTETAPSGLAAPADTLRADAGAGLGTALDVPSPPSGVQEFAAELLARGTADYPRAQLLATVLRDRVRFVTKDPGGHAYGDVERLLSGEPGNVEQIAVAFAVLARLLGLPSRIVVGFEKVSPAAGGRVDVLTGDVAVWPEIAFEGVGWVPFDPFPPATQPDTKPRDQEPQVDPGPPSRQSPVQPPQVSGPSSPDDPPPGPSVLWWVLATVAGGLAVVALAAYLTGVLLAPRLARRIWRSSPDPRRLLVGAWTDVRMGLTDSGVSLPASASSQDVLKIVGGRGVAGAVELLTPLAALADRALFAAGTPSRSDAGEAWRRADRFRAALRRSQSRRARLRRALRPGRLRRPGVSTPLLRLRDYVRWLGPAGQWRRVDSWLEDM